MYDIVILFKSLRTRDIGLIGNLPVWKFINQSVFFFVKNSCLQTRIVDIDRRRGWRLSAHWTPRYHSIAAMFGGLRRWERDLNWAAMMLRGCRSFSYVGCFPTKDMQTAPLRSGHIYIKDAHSAESSETSYFRFLFPELWWILYSKFI